MTGRIFLSFTEKIIAALNEGVIPTIKDAWEDVMEQQSKKIYDKALEIYHSEINSIISSVSTKDKETLKKTHLRLEAELKKYIEKELKSYSKVEGVISKLMGTISEEYKTKKKELVIKLDRDANELLHSEYRKIMGENYGTLEEMWKSFDKIEEVFLAKVKLVNRGEILHKFEKEKIRIMADRVVKNVQTQDAMLLHTKEAEITTLKEMMKMKEDGSKVVNDKRLTDLNEKLLSNQRKVRDLENTVEAATKIMGEKDEEILKLEEQIKSMKMQYLRISGKGAPKQEVSEFGDIKIEQEESFPVCGGKNSGCSVF